MWVGVEGPAGKLGEPGGRGSRGCGVVAPGPWGGVWGGSGGGRDGWGEGGDGRVEGAEAATVREKGGAGALAGGVEATWDRAAPQEGLDRRWRWRDWRRHWGRRRGRRRERSWGRGGVRAPVHSGGRGLGQGRRRRRRGGSGWPGNGKNQSYPQHTHTPKYLERAEADACRAQCHMRTGCNVALTTGCTRAAP